MHNAHLVQPCALRSVNASKITANKLHTSQLISHQGYSYTSANQHRYSRA